MGTKKDKSQTIIIEPGRANRHRVDTFIIPRRTNHPLGTRFELREKGLRYGTNIPLFAELITFVCFCSIER